MFKTLASLFGRNLYFKKLLLGFFIISVVPTILTVSILHSNYANSMVDEISEANIKLLEQIRISMDAITNEIMNIANNSNLDSELAFFSQYPFVQDVTRFNKLSENINRLKENSKYVDNIFVYFEEFDYIISAPAREQGVFYRMSHAEKPGWYQLYQKMKPYQIMVVDSMGSGNKNIILLKPIINRSLKVNGVMVIVTKYSNVYRIMDKIKTPNLENLYILDSEKNILFERVEGNGWDEKGLLKQLVLNKPGYKVEGIGEGGKLIAQTVSEDNGWIFVSITPIKQIIKKIGIIKNISIYISLLIITISLVLSLFYGKYLYKPIKYITKSIGKVNKVGQEQPDELKEIVNAFGSILENKIYLEGIIEKNRDIMKDKFLTNILFGYDYKDNEVTEKLNFFKLQLPFPCFCVLLIKSDISNLDVTKIELKSSTSWKISMITLADQILKEMKREGIVFEAAYENIAVLINYDDMEDLADVSKQYCYKLRETFVNYLPFTVSISVGNGVKGIQKIQESYAQAIKALDYRVVLGRNKTIYINDVLCPKDIILQAEIFENKIGNHLFNRNLQALYQLTDEAADMVKSNQLLTRANVENFFLQIILYTLNSVEKNNIKVYRKLCSEPLYIEFLKNETLEDMVYWLKLFYERVINNLEELNESICTGYQKIDLAVKFIEENYTKSLSLTVVAEKVGLNPSYFSNLFKEVTRKSFIEYVYLLRVEKSKGLMIDFNTPLYDIAQKVGFANNQAFIRFFKKYEGCSPSRFRQILVTKNMKNI